MSEEISLTFDQVRELLPQRFPMMMVDTVVSCDKGKSIQCLKNVSGNDIMINGHFPEAAIFPGVLILEGVAQSAILLYRLSYSGAYEHCVHLFGAVKARFVNPVYPGDQMIYNVELTSENRVATTFLGEVRVGGKTVARCELAMATRPQGSEVQK